MSIIKCPVLIIASKEDKLINYSHAEKIYEAILHKDREIYFIKGEHYDMREDSTVRHIINFINNTCRTSNRLEKHNPLTFSSKLPKYALPSRNSNSEFSMEKNSQVHKSLVKSISINQSADVIAHKKELMTN